MDKPYRKIGIIAGSGQLPHLIIKAASEQARTYIVIGIHGDTDTYAVEQHPHEWLNSNEIIRTLEIFKKSQVSHIVMVGKISRPSLKALRPPLLAAKIVSRLGKALFRGDNALFSAITSIFEEEGFSVIGADDLLEDLIAPEGILGDISPDTHAQSDITRGMSLLQKMGELDIGQGLIIKHGQILGVEALEGTDAMIDRCAALGDKTQSGGVLIKAKKSQQERRVDLPAIGPKTILNLANAGFAGVAIQAGSTLIIDRKATVTAANDHQIFIVSITANV